ncbi:MAG: hemerythrin family protein [gamma proteobacterium endosymbiont of Lamellibrachia anaximandri]|nr:hemerythrin family protein [gamma proteobacterium endosymbiont of Lamellibrachia anaximandri]MBL3532753.1 hemerythrin family protein [gamma proteobacterium endosymbiont of Lamellibrachia anaximandri]MBL3598755.1 hemerythrin family protein [gamma proteobacterium endosymbiont of Lamellibrachia anaximandri]
MKTRKPAQKVSLVVAYICYVVAVITLFAAGYRAYTVGTDNPIFASLAASVFFFVCCGIVLQVIGSVSLPDLKIDPKGSE